jgi:RHS repeat-associated protein
MTAGLRENSHQGFEGIKAAHCLARLKAKSNIASGMPACLRPDGTGSRCSGKERDVESGLDYFLARYYSAAQGRFTSPDEFQGGAVDPFTGQQVGQPGPLPYADITDPQTLNKYAYVRNNPLRYTDPDGHCFWDACVLETVLVYTAYAATAATGAYLLNNAINQTKAWYSSKESSGHSGESQSTPGKVEPYDVGEAKDLKDRSAPGDNVDVHHVPQQNPAGQTVAGYDGKTAPAIALPKDEHKAIPTEKGTATRTPRDQLAKDAKDLRNNTNTPNSQVQKVIDLNKKKYPEMNKPQ